jgi:hypothetical protein
MPLIDIVIGRVVGLWFETPAAYLSGLILLAVGFHTVREALSTLFLDQSHSAVLWGPVQFCPVASLFDPLPTFISERYFSIAPQYFSWPFL